MTRRSMTMTITHPRSTAGRGTTSAPSGLTLRDQAATIFVGLETLIVAAVLGEWGWPGLGSARGGILAAGALGLGACIVGAQLDEETSWRSGFIALAAILGTGAVGLLVAGLVTGSKELLVAFVVLNVTLWIVTTARHALER
jgi:hypothetical protein